MSTNPEGFIHCRIARRRWSALRPGALQTHTLHSAFTGHRNLLYAGVSSLGEGFLAYSPPIVHPTAMALVLKTLRPDIHKNWVCT